MGIVFAQPSPMAPDIVSAAGAAEQWSKDAPMLARMYESAASNQTQASIAAAHLNQQGAAAHAQTAEQATARNDALAQQQQQFNISQYASPRDAFHAQAALAQQQQKAELGAWLQQQDLSQAEGMRLQRLQGAVGHVMADETLDPETKQNLLMQLKTGIDPLRQRVEMGKAKLEEQQTQRAMHAMAQQEKIEQMNQGERAKFFQARQVTATDPATGESHFGWIDDKGNFQPFKSEKKDHSQSEEAMIERLTKFEQHAMDMGIKQQKADMDAWDKKRQATIDAGREDPGSMPGSKDVGSYMQYYLDRMPGYSDLRAKLENRGQTQQQPGVTNPPPATNPQGGTGQAQQSALTTPPATVTPQALEGLKPFDWTKPETMAPAQKEWIDGLKERRQTMSARRDIPEKDRWAAEDAYTDLKELLARHGSYAKMTVGEKEKYDAAEKVIARIPKNPNPTKFWPAFYKAFSEGGDAGGHS